jgi:uncharacterized protein YjbI with pentapeptide repeats
MLKAPMKVPAIDVFHLTGWTDDECIEYLAHAHRDKVDSVMRRLKANDFVNELGGSPLLLRAVMNQLANYDSLTDALDAMLLLLRAILATEGEWNAAVNASLARRYGGGPASYYSSRISDRARRFLSHPAFEIALCAEGTIEILRNRLIPKYLQKMTQTIDVRAIARAARSNSKVIHRLEDLLAGPDRASDAMAASVLLKIDSDWRPPQQQVYSFHQAVLSGAKWPQIDLSQSCVSGATFAGADLCQAKLKGVIAHATSFVGAKLEHATLEGADLLQTNFGSAGLSYATLDMANLQEGILDMADLTHATARGTNLSDASLVGADFSHADLAAALMIGCSVENADFSHASLEGAAISKVHMNRAVWTHASFNRAGLENCDLSGLVLPAANFKLANLTGSDLTATRIPGGQFEGANLHGTGLAEIDWENADLRDADFTQASFHMGSSRSGLVGSVIPSEGSKTGFYTDEFNEQDFKAPEEIRKANLRGANLIGAKVTGTDWYLVDLRDATYSDDQADHFARCGAILATRVR